MNTLYNCLGRILEDIIRNKQPLEDEDLEMFKFSVMQNISNIINDTSLESTDKKMMLDNMELYFEMIFEIEVQNNNSNFNEMDEWNHDYIHSLGIL